MPWNKPIFKGILPSPFLYREQARVFIPTDIPPPSSSDSPSSAFIRSALLFVKDLILVSKGGVFVLCTSFNQIQLLKNYLEDSCCPFPLFIQGEGNRMDIIQKFKDSRNGVLLGTDSFWEGVDIRGNALRTVILFKLPFRPPNDPVTETLYELEEKRGGNPFFKIAVPEAVLKFKQGFGRLLRSQSDRGVIAFLDKRIIEKKYGKIFIHSLPIEKEEILIQKSSELIEIASEFLAGQLSER